MFLRKVFSSIFLSCLVFVTIQAQDTALVNDNLVRFYYPNGQVSSMGTMRDGKPDGYWSTYYVSGVIKSEGTRINYLLDSIWCFYNQAGELTSRISYKLGEKNGYSYKYNFNNPNYPGQSTLISKELYVMGKKEGRSFYHYPTGELNYTVFYKDGKKQGLSREYARDSVLINVVTYRDNYMVERERVNREDEEGLKQGLFRNYYDNGKIKKEEHYLDNQLHGYYREFDGRGELVLALRYERGVIIEEIDEDIKELLDMKSTYDEQGRLIFTGGYKDGVALGIHRYFDTLGIVENAQLYNEKGEKVSEGIIDEQGRRKGAWKDFYPGGELRAEGSYLNNRKSGTWTYYYQSRRIEQKGKFERGRYHGRWMWYYPNGNTWREESYFNGREDGQFTEYDQGGNILSSGDYISGEKEGEWTYQVGDHQEKGSFVIGLREGIWYHYYPDGTLKYEGLYTQGNPDKKHKYYYPNGKMKEEQYYDFGIREKIWKKYNTEGELLMTITYKKNVEQRINGIRVKLPDSDVTLIQ